MPGTIGDGRAVPGGGRESLFYCPPATCRLGPVSRDSGMPFGDEQATLAARLARAAGSRGVVCLGCPVAGSGVAEPGLITLSRPPLVDVCIEPERLLLVVVPQRARDRDLASFAAAGVPEVWLLAGQVVHSLSRPVGGRYRRRSLILPGEEVHLARLPAVLIVPLPGD